MCTLETGSYANSQANCKKYQHAEFYTLLSDTSTCWKRTASRRSCKKKNLVKFKKTKKRERGKVRGRKYTNNYNAEPHPTLIQTNNERRDSQKGKKYQDTENKDYKNTRGWIKTKNSKWRGRQKSQVSTSWILAVVYEPEQKRQKKPQLTNTDVLSKAVWQQRIDLDGFFFFRDAHQCWCFT